MKKSGIYRIQSNHYPKRFYIGSACNISQRFKQHKWKLKANRHENTLLQRHFNKYGKSDLKYSIILECDKTDLLAMEQIFIDSMNPYFNLLKKAGSNLGYKHREDTKEKMKVSAKNVIRKPLSDEHKQNISKALQGKKKSIEHRRKIGLAKIGNKYCAGLKRQISAEHRDNLRLSHLGKKPSEETKKKMSETHKRRQKEIKLKKIA